MSDQQISCSDCGDVFLFSEPEQAFYREKGLAAPPKRCKACRQARKASSPQAGARPSGGGFGARRGNDSGGYRGASNGGGWGGGGGDARGGDRNGQGRGPAPARRGEGRGQPRGAFAGPPRGARGAGPQRADGGAPPYRSPAFPEQRWQPRGAPPAPHDERAPAAPRARAERPERPKFDITCVTCGVLAQVPFKPIEGREVFCKACYQARRGVERPAEAAADPGGSDNGIIE